MSNSKLENEWEHAHDETLKFVEEAVNTTMLKTIAYYCGNDIYRRYELFENENPQHLPPLRVKQLLDFYKGKHGGVLEGLLQKFIDTLKKRGKKYFNELIANLEKGLCDNENGPGSSQKKQDDSNQSGSDQQGTDTGSMNSEGNLSRQKDCSSTEDSSTEDLKNDRIRVTNKTPRNTVVWKSKYSRTKKESPTNTNTKKVSAESTSSGYSSTSDINSQLILSPTRKCWKNLENEFEKNEENLDQHVSLRSPYSSPIKSCKCKTSSQKGKHHKHARKKCRVDNSSQLTVPSSSHKNTLEVTKNLFQYLSNIGIDSSIVDIIEAPIEVASNLIGFEHLPPKKHIKNLIGHMQNLIHCIQPSEKMFDPFAAMQLIDYKDEKFGYFVKPVPKHKNIETSVRRINKTFHDFIKDSSNYKVQEGLCANLSDDIERTIRSIGDIDCLKGRTLGKHLVSLSEAFSENVVKDVFAFVILAKAKYLYLDSADKINKEKTLEDVMSCFRDFNEDFIKINDYIKNLLGYRIDYETGVWKATDPGNYVIDGLKNEKIPGELKQCKLCNEYINGQDAIGIHLLVMHRISEEQQTRLEQHGVTFYLQ